MKVAYPQKSIRLLKTMAAFLMFKGTLKIFFVEKRLHSYLVLLYCEFLLYGNMILRIIFDIVFTD